MSENTPSENEMRCYEEDTEYTLKIFKENGRFLELEVVSILAISLILYIIFKDTMFLTAILVSIVWLTSMIIGKAYANIDGKKYSYIKKICFDEHGMHIDFFSQSLFIPFENILYIYPPKKILGHIGYLLELGKKGKRKYKVLWVSGALFYIIKDEIINYFKAKGGRPPFLVVMPEERAAMRNTVVWLQTYAVENKKKKMDRILERFWSKHTLEEFE